MWLITDFGFFSVVAKPGDEKAGTLTVRARQRGDLESLRGHYLATMGPITESRTTDYRYRARAPKGDVAAAMAKAIEAVTYSNFKNQVRKTQGAAREAVLHRVWHELYALQRP